MTLGELVYFIQIIAENKGYQKKISREQMNLLIQQASIDLAKEKYGYLDSPTGYETHQQIKDALRKFKEISTIVVDASGHMTIPSDYFHKGTIRYGTVPVDIVTDQVADELNASSILAPTTSYPIAVECDTYYQFYPITLGSVVFTYYRLPTEPVYATKIENSIPVYDVAGSTELEWTEEYHIEIIRKVLSYLMISVGDMEVTQYVEAKQTQEN